VQFSETARRRAAFGLAAVVFVGVLAGTVARARSASAGTAQISTAPLVAAHRTSTVYSLTVNGVPVPVNGYAGYDYAEFSMGGGWADVAVTKLNGTNVGTAAISPVKQGYTAVREGSTATFTMRGPEYLIVKLDGQRRLVLAADPAETDRPAATGTGIFNVTDPVFGADPTGAAVSTEAIQEALDAASDFGSQPGNPRGIVYVPRGLYPAGNLELRSNTAVYLEAGAVLRVVADKSLYTADAHKTSQKRDLTWWIQTEFGSRNIKLYGRGTLDGNGMAATRAGFGPNVLVPIATSDFTLDGLTIREGGSWTVIPTRSNDLSFTNMKVFNRFDMGENDSFDAIESQNVVVRRGIGISLDDSYSTKSWPKQVGITKNWPGDPEVVRDVTFDGLLAWTYCYAYKIGQGVVTDHEGVTFSNSVVHDAAVALGIHHKSGAGTARDVAFSNIDVEHLSGDNDKHQTWLAFMIEDAYSDGAGPIAGVRLSHINVRFAGSTPALLAGFSETSSITGVTFDSIRMPGSASYASTPDELRLAPRTFAAEPTVTAGS
jgi:hypothetical protein